MACQHSFVATNNEAPYDTDDRCRFCGELAADVEDEIVAVGDQPSWYRTFPDDLEQDVNRGWSFGDDDAEFDTDDDELDEDELDDDELDDDDDDEYDDDGRFGRPIFVPDDDDEDA